MMQRIDNFCVVMDEKDMNDGLIKEVVRWNFQNEF